MDRPESDGRATRAAWLPPRLRRCGCVVLLVVAAWPPAKEVHAIDYAVAGGGPTSSGAGYVEGEAVAQRSDGSTTYLYTIELCVGQPSCCCIDDCPKTSEGCTPVSDDPPGRVGQECCKQHCEQCCPPRPRRTHQTCCSIGAACCGTHPNAQRGAPACDALMTKCWLCQADSDCDPPLEKICDSTDATVKNCVLIVGHFRQEFLSKTEIDPDKHDFYIEVENNRCQDGPQAGELCVSNNDCEAGSCKESGRCDNAGLPGQTCTLGGSECDPDPCRGSGWCQGGNVPGDPCFDDTQCDPGVCVGLWCCQGGASVGQPCLTTDDCGGETCAECAANSSGRLIIGGKPPDAPTLSAWGLVTLTVVLLAAGTLVLRRRRLVAAL